MPKKDVLSHTPPLTNFETKPKDTVIVKGVKLPPAKGRHTFNLTDNERDPTKLTLADEHFNRTYPTTQQRTDLGFQDELEIC